jgi:hypothetical protein
MMRKTELLASIGLLIGLLGCGDDDASGDAQSTAAKTCARTCARAQAANCPRQPSNCQQLCVDDIEATPAGCIGFANAFAECLGAAVFSCDAQGQAEARSCSTQLASWTSCVTGVPPGVPDASASADAGADASISTPPDAAMQDAASQDAASQDAASQLSDAGNDTGVPGPDGGSLFTCAPEPADEACDTCIKTACCATYLACDLSCAQLTTCLNSCALEDFTCAAQCENLYALGIPGFDALIECVGRSCEAQCSE